MARAMSEVLHEAASHADCGRDHRSLGGVDEAGESKREAKDANAQRASASGWPRKAAAQQPSSAVRLFRVRWSALLGRSPAILNLRPLFYAHLLIYDTLCLTVIAFGQTS